MYKKAYLNELTCTIIGSLSKDTLITDAFNLFSEMISKGIAADVKTYTYLISEAENLLRKMEEDGCFPNDFTFNTIIRGFIKNNEISGALVLAEQMKERGFSADASTT